MHNLLGAKMGKYGKAAVIASQILVKPKTMTPRDAWDTAVAQVFPDSESSQTKGCPRDTFLSLCEMGLLENVPTGSYTKSIKNKSYATLAIAKLRDNPELLEDEKRLWQIVTDGANKAPNYQMDVITTLWRQKLIQNVL